MWNIDAGKALYTICDLPEVSGLTFAPYGKPFVVTANNQLAQIRAAETGQVLHTFDKLNWGQYTFSPDGAYLAAFIDFEVRLWNAKTWQSLPIEGNHIPAGGRIAFSPDGERLALGGHDGVVTVWETRTGHKLQELKGAAGNIGAVWFSPDGKTLAALDTDQRGDASTLSTGGITWDTTGQMTRALTLQGGNRVEGAYSGAVGNTFLLPDQLCQFDPSAHSLKFWELPILPAKP